MKSSKHLAFLAGACTMPLEAASTIQFTLTPTVYQVAENAGTVAFRFKTEYMKRMSMKSQEKGNL